MIRVLPDITPSSLLPDIHRMWEVSGPKIRALDAREKPGDATPVFTIRGKYTARGWTEWTQGFVYGSALLQFDATGDASFLEIGRRRTVDRMAHHITHVGVHDHGFNNVSTYGNLLRLMNEGRIEENPREREFLELALKCSGAVQAARWTDIGDGLGYEYSFNGPQSLFSDTIRSMRALSLGYSLGHVLMGEGDQPISLLDRLLRHSEATARYNVYFGEGRDAYDVRGRVVHESIFNVNNGAYRCPSTQQGYSPFSTWTRGLSWILCGYPEQLGYFLTLSETDFEPYGGREKWLMRFEQVARAVADFFIDQTPTDGIPYWDTGAPGLARMGNYLDRPADPFNDFEPVDSSAAAVSAQGLLRLGRYLAGRGDADASRYIQAGLTVTRSLLADPYVSRDLNHEGLLLHSVYHRPNGWDHIPEGRKVPCGEACMWGDYHLRELALYVQRLAADEDLGFFGALKS